jgi:uncharacterized protein (TIGR03067 family)
MRGLMLLTFFGLLGAVGGVTAGDKAKDREKDPAKKELDAFQGAWTSAELVYNGKDFLADGKAPLRFVFKGNEATIEASEAVKKEYAKIKIKLDPSTMPKCVDITVSAGGQINAVIEGIYELKKDEIRICAKVLGKERPNEFASPDGSSIVLLVLKRPAP